MSGTTPNGAPPGASDLPQEMKGRQQSSSKMAYMAVIAVVVIVVIIVLAGWQLGWFKSNSSTPATASCPAPVSLTGAGSTFVFPLMYQWYTTYTGSTVNYESVGSGTGISDISAKTVDFGASDAPLTPAQKTNASGILQMPESAGAVAIIFNLPNVNFAAGKSLNVNGSVLAQIFLGTIMNWNNTPLQTLNPGLTLPIDPISVQHRSDGSGTTYAFTQFLSSASTQWATQVGYSTTVNWPVGTGDKGSSGIAGAVETTQYSIAYVDLNYALNNEIHFAAVENPTGAFILPSVNDTASAIADSKDSTNLPLGTGNWSGVDVENAPGAKDYPIATFTYLMFYQNPYAAYGSSYTLQKAENLVNFLNWTIHAGQSYSEGLYYVTLPSSVVAADVVTLDSMNYNGAAIPQAACG
ncbi:MAG: phosphate ABC transporter substrate-binding protein PstS [Thermoplasmata archaeon]|nr:phosphate ABC transporter substrate-binding protein PstS [Thermoplasmata archaeon]